VFTTVPEKHVAFALFTNVEEPGTLSSRQFRLLDHYLGLKGADWIAAVHETLNERLEKAKEQLAAGKERIRKSRGATDRRCRSRSTRASIAMPGTAQ
jgi:hypothetical protein